MRLPHWKEDQSEAEMVMELPIQMCKIWKRKMKSLKKVFIPNIGEVLMDKDQQIISSLEHSLTLMYKVVVVNTRDEED